MRSIGELPLESLLLDVDNPRLPEFLDDLSQEGILEHLYRRAALQELAESIYSNGFFSSEPLIVGPEEDGKRVVLEGNRRLATLLILSQDPRAESAGLAFRIDGSTVSIPLDRVPVVEVDNAEEFAAYLGFRHISGLRMWGAGEKARYLWRQVKQVSEKEGDSSFYRVGRTVGSNARGVRNAYIAYEVLEHARREGVDAELVSFIITERFGVWVRLLGTKNVSKSIGLVENAHSLSEVTESIEQVNLRALEGVLSDLRPASGRAEAVIRDSRQVTAYSDVLGDPVALELLRSSGNLDLADAVANRPNVDGQLQGIADQLEVVTNQMADQSQLSEETIPLTKRVVRAARLAEVAAVTFSIED